jgi:hypothetical protein
MMLVREGMSAGPYEMGLIEDRPMCGSDLGFWRISEWRADASSEVLGHRYISPVNRCTEEL